MGNDALGDAALWWRERAAAEHDDIDLYILGPARVERDRGCSGSSMFERARVTGPLTPGRWSVRIRAYDMQGPFLLPAIVYWVADVGGGDGPSPPERATGVPDLPAPGAAWSPREAPSGAVPADLPGRVVEKFPHLTTERAPASPQVPAPVGKSGAPGTTRTCDLQVRNLTLYPTELRARDVASGEPWAAGSAGR